MNTLIGTLPSGDWHVSDNMGAGARERETILAGRQIAAWSIVNLRFRELPPQRAKRFRRSLDDWTAQNGVGRPPQLAPLSLQAPATRPIGFLGLAITIPFLSERVLFRPVPMAGSTSKRKPARNYSRDQKMPRLVGLQAEARGALG